MARPAKEVSKPTHALALVRISDDPEERAIGVKRQEKDCRELAARLGWAIGEVIVENDTSAYKTKQTRDDDGLPVRVTRRPEFRRALRAVHSGQADGLIIYDIDRLARRARDLEALIDVVEGRGVPVVAVTGSVDVATSAGRAMSRVMVAMATKSSEDTARRVARAAKQRAEQGAPKVDGFRPYGYDRDMQVIPEEAAVIREIADRILAGDAYRAIASDLNARGIKPTRAAAWSPTGLKWAVRKPTIAGIRAYTPTEPPGAETVFYPGTWEPILDEDTWQLVVDRLDTSSGQRTRAVDRYLLSGIAVCGLCGGRCYVAVRRDKPSLYRCNECHRVSRRMDFVDDQVVAVVRELLGDTRAVAARRKAASKGGSHGLAELTALRERRRLILRDFATDLAATDLTEMLSAVDDRIAALEAEHAGRGGVRLPKLREFDALSLARKRAVVRSLVEVTILPVGKGSRLTDEGLRITPAY